ncbi:hypothetical protein [Marininema halotolerans]|uniref:Uncharacterized protein n=1 Tax=Marininema halotolerans TaxID=1155944 RepID=A0A1I6UM78_9BACL|nr:hypothetical protein [Marininema halotolerans]SFT02550.1 hypothetical protein SAMN05444972_11823 [Marininema halotolerans]
MKEKSMMERLSYIFNCYLKGDPVWIECDTFCDEFHDLYGLNFADSSIELLGTDKREELTELLRICSRFNPCISEHVKYPNAYTNEMDVYTKSTEVWEMIFDK